MEDIKTKEFLKIGDGYGSGSGSGSGSGYGYGSGSGYGSGDGYGSGSGSGSGYGSGSGSGSGYGYGSGSGSGYGYGSGSGYGDGDGSGSGLKSIKKLTVNIIDGVATAITSIHKNIAKGFILNNDLTMDKCYVVKQDNYFAHGKTAQEAIQALHEKIFDDMDVEEKIELFWEEFSLGKKYSAKKFYEWHNKLTRSCDIGRQSFVKNHDINLDTDMFTVDEFIELTKDDYGGEIIRKLSEATKEE